MPDPSDPTPPDLEITFAEGFAPPLPADSYKITAKQNLTISSEPKAIPFKAEKTVHVSAPRFALNPGEVYSVYPPAGQSGAFHAALPHIVLTRKTLPWERIVEETARVDDTTDKKNIRSPWMALLTLDDHEIATEKVEIKSIPLREVYNPGPQTRTPNIRHEPGERLGPPPAEEDHCTVARMPAPLFRKIAPALDELRFLAHARQVGSADKDLADIVADGWVAVVVGNRKPQCERRNHGLLVSLEGLGGVLQAHRSEDPAAGWEQRWVQPVVLHHWTYVSEGKRFDELLDGLTKQDGEERDVWLRVQHLPPGENPSENRALAALNYGYTALNHHLRQGGRGVSWYRGPLIPLRLDASPSHTAHTNADAALLYDPVTNFFNVSYAAAWQLGRLLALQNLTVATSLLHRADGYVSEGALEEAKKALNQSDAIEEQAKLLLGDQLTLGLLAEWWLSDPANPGGH